MAAIVPSPPGFSVLFGAQAQRRFAEPAPHNIFCVGFFDRGDFGQGAGIGDLIDQFGGHVNYANSPDGLIATLAETGYATTWTVARVVGPAAAKAQVVMSTVTIKAKTVGAWANGATGGLSATITAIGGSRTITVELGGNVVAVSPTTTAIADLTSWVNDYVTVTGTSLPVATPEANLAGGTDDRASVTAADWKIAADKLEKKYGPGFLVAPDATTEAVQQVLLAHCDGPNNRRARLGWGDGISKAAAQTAMAALQLDSFDTVKNAGWFASWGKTTPIAGDPERTVPYACIDAGIASRLVRTRGVALPTFGPEGASSQTVTELTSNWTDADRSDLYSDAINVATDDGGSIATWGYKTGDPDELQSDLHHQTVRMGFQFDAEQIMRSFIGSPIDASALASLNGKLDALCQEYVKARALYGYAIDVDTVNTPATAQAREIHAALQIKHTPTSDWVDLSILVAPITA